MKISREGRHTQHSRGSINTNTRAFMEEQKKRSIAVRQLTVMAATMNT
jgi:hypothetical protein